MTILPRALVGAALALATASAAAAPAPLWQNNSLTLLYGQDFTVAPEIQRTATFEHASGWRYGDLFAFIDVTGFNGAADAGAGKSTWYGEFAPRLSLGKLSGRALQAGPLRDVLVAGAVEFGEGEVDTALLGLGIDLQVPGFDYVQLNGYRRQRLGNGRSDGWQLTPVWSLTRPFGRSDVVFDGFIDWMPSNQGRHANLHVNPQLKYDLGKALGAPARRAYVGIEYDYWKNKFGIDDDGPVGRAVGGSDQNTFSLLLKLHLP